ncbi:MAG: alpha-amylase/4-alpha-glucanotransferase domain-containing protein [Promethearchaeota archaeon]|jgi:alpha-amylase
MMLEERKIHLPIVFHFHQPTDQLDFIYEDVFEKSYEPLINSIYQFPNVKFTLHFSGNLLEWLIDNKPQFIEKLKAMAKKGQIEIIGGGYYEPIFALIPYRDKIAQMKKLSDLIKSEFDLDVKGAWLSERVWEPDYPSFLNDIGLKYVIVDDNHFRSTGITEEETLYSYVTEDEGKTLRIFPINEELRYLTPWKPTYMSIDYLRKMADTVNDRIAVLISDAEKMGVWGTTHEICYVEGQGHQEGDNGKPFIPAFFEQVQKNEWITSTTLTEYMEKFPAKSLIYLPTASYDKMEEWVLPTKIRKNFKKIRKALKDDNREVYQFLKGGFWRYFLVKYPESNNMHKKMLYVREKLIFTEENLMKVDEESIFSIILNTINNAWDEIYKAQCNDCYWHGLFGGVYLQFLRFSVYTHLINAEKLIDTINAIINPKLASYIYITPLDFTKDSKTEYIIESDIYNLYINPNDGGTIFELDYKPKSYNLLNTLTRWPEAYHESKKLEAENVFLDRFRRTMLRLRILHKDVTFEQLQADNYHEFGDFVEGGFTVTSSEKDGRVAILEMERVGTVKDTTSDERVPVRITKDIYVEDNEIEIRTRVSFEDLQENEEILRRITNNLKLVVDIPFFFNGDPNKFQLKYNKTESEQIDIVDPLSLFHYEGINFNAYDETYDLSMIYALDSAQNPTKFVGFPLIANAYTDEGYKKIYQGVNISILFDIDESLEFHLKLTIL